MKMTVIDRSKEIYFGEVTDDVKSLGIEFGQNVEHERIRVVKESLVIEK